MEYTAHEVLAWANGGDAGLSSLEMASHFTGLPLVPAPWSGWRSHYPRDPADFGRCHRMLLRFPAWKARLPELASLSAEWKGMVEAWPELERLWEVESKSKDGMAPQLYKRMKAIERAAKADAA